MSDEADEDSRAYTLRQYRRFTAMTEALADKGVAFAIRHCANSGAAAGYPQFACDMFRPGIVSYGIGHQAEALGLRPVMTLKTVVGAVRELPEDTAVSYGCTFRTARPSRIGVLPIGYADGLPGGVVDGVMDSVDLHLAALPDLGQAGEVCHAHVHADAPHDRRGPPGRPVSATRRRTWACGR